jgi:hypothetical protein
VGQSTAPKRYVIRCWDANNTLLQSEKLLLNRLGKIDEKQSFREAEKEAIPNQEASNTQ